MQRSLVVEPMEGVGRLVVYRFLILNRGADRSKPKNPNPLESPGENRQEETPLNEMCPGCRNSFDFVALNVYQRLGSHERPTKIMSYRVGSRGYFQGVAIPRAAPGVRLFF